MASKKHDGALYVGKGLAYVPGVPMNNMTAEEWHELPAELRKLALASKLYEVSTEVETPEAPDAPAVTQEVTP